MTDSVSGAVTRYYYNGDRVIAEYDGSTGSLQRYFVCGGNYIDELAVIHDALLGDQFVMLGRNYSVAGLVDATGGTLQTYSYDGFGRTGVNGVGAPMSPYLYTGRRLDLLDSGAMSIQYNRARYYSPLHGRWCSRDPSEYKDGSNLYEYARSRPTQATDPLGLIAAPDCVKFPTDAADKGKGPDPKKGFLGNKTKWGADGSYGFGPVKLEFGFKAEVQGQVCKKCCKAGTKFEGEERWDYDLTVTGKAFIEASASTYGGSVKFKKWGQQFEFSFWLGLKLTLGVTGASTSAASSGAGVWYPSEPSCAERPSVAARTRAVRISAGLIKYDCMPTG